MVKMSFAIIILLLVSQLFAQDNTTFKAQKGDGIYSVLKQNGMNSPEYFNQFVVLNQSKLGKNNALILGETYKLPQRKNAQGIESSEPKLSDTKTTTVPTTTIQEIYGPAYREITIRNKSLSGAVFYLESGHGGPDPGAIGNLDGHDLYEDEYAYDVTLRLARNLSECDAKVFMIIGDNNDGIRDEQYLNPDKDEVCYPNQEIPFNQLARLKQSNDAVNRLHRIHKGKFQKLVIIHVDS